MQYIKYLIIIIILVIIALSITKTKKKDYKIEVNKLVDYLGGKNNIIDYEFNKSRFIVKLENVELANKDAIQKMGAQGIVEIDNQLKIVLGPDCKQLKKYIDDLK
jgi:phosphotransferase system IIB component